MASHMTQFRNPRGKIVDTLQSRHHERDGVSNHQPNDYLLNRFFKAQIIGTSKLRVTGLCEENSLVTGKFPAQRASNAENVFIWWRHHEQSASYLILDPRIKVIWFDKSRALSSTKIQQ